jgi:hypothetical protein
MFTKLRSAYAMQVEALTDHAGSVRGADRKFRAFYGLDDAAAPTTALAEARDDRKPITMGIPASRSACRNKSGPVAF